MLTRDLNFSREYLDAVLRFNSERNALLLVTLKRVAALLNAIDIEPVVLKGATELITGSYPAAGMRVIGDLDLLIPIDRAQSAAAALKKAGFAPVGPPLPPNHHHLPVLADPETAAGVELHMTVVHNRSEALKDEERIPIRTRTCGPGRSRRRRPSTRDNRTTGTSCHAPARNRWAQRDAAESR